MILQEISKPIIAFGVPIINQSVNEMVSSGTKSSTVDLAIRLGAVLIRSNIAPAVAACPNDRKLASAYLLLLSFELTFLGWLLSITSLLLGVLCVFPPSFVLVVPIGIFRIFINATTKENTMVVEAVIEPVIESIKTGREAMKNNAI
jgi:hypothetical protein